MDSWQEIALSSYDASKRLQMTGHWRSSVSRSYYAAYAAITNELSGAKGVSFRHGDNPSHAQLKALVEHHLSRKKFSDIKRHEVKKSINNLYKARLEADYMPNRAFSQTEARDALRQAGTVFRILGLNP